MMTAELGACEWFVWDLRRSNLVERGKLEQLVADYMARHPKAEPAELAAHLVDQRILTRFQADSLLNGKSQGLVLGSFIVHDILGSGTMGTVYKARSKVNNDWYAVKVLPRRSMWNIRLARRKVRDFEQFSHAAVVPFVDVGTAGAMHYLSWPLIEGEPLSKMVERQGRLPSPEVALYGMLAAEGLESAHQRSILHGLLKPSNVMITPDQRVKILDFGVGSLLLEAESGESVVDTMSSANTLASGLDCASPEGIMDPASMSFPSDQYSLGCILYYCLTGQYPFPGNNAVEKMMAHQTKQPKSIRDLAPDCPDELIEVVDRLMRKDPGDRYGSMGEVASALRPLAMMAMPAQAAPARAAAPRRAQTPPVAAHARNNGVPAAAPPAAPVYEQVGFDGDEPIYQAPPAPGRGRPSNPVARPTPQPVRAFEDTVADANLGQYGFVPAAHDPRISGHRQAAVPAGSHVHPAAPYHQVPPPAQQGITMKTLLIVVAATLVGTLFLSLGGLILLVKSGLLKMG
jgi:hypothetical protein